MKNKNYNYSAIALVTALILVLSVHCTRDFDELEKAGFPTTAEVFIDGFSSGLKYAAFGGSKVSAFEVDKEVKYAGTASMRFEVPDQGDPAGAYAGGVYYTTVGRDLSDYTALTFWAKASKSATLDLVGFGNDMNESKYLVSLNNAKLSPYWKKYIIPIPDPSVLSQEKGMFYYSEGPEDGLGYTFWIDEVKFEKLGTIAHKKAKILNGNDETESVVNGLSIPIDGLSVSFNMPDGIDQEVVAAPAFFNFTSSDNNVATVDESGLVTVLSEGTAVITANEGGVDALGSLTVESLGDFVHAPTPTADPADVISIFSNAYTNEPVDYYNGYWQFSTTTSADFTVNDDDVLFYNNFNFVGIQFTSPTIDGSNMTHLHMDVWIPNAVDPSDELEINVIDLGSDGSFEGTNPTLNYKVAAPLETQSWISVDIDLSSLSSKSNLAQIGFAGGNSTFTGFYLDNVYFYNDGGSTVAGPTVAAPTPPARDAADVISIYGDEYTNLSGTDYPDWGQATVVSDVLIEGNNTLKFAGLNFQGIQLPGAQDVSGMESLHLDFWTANSSTLNVYLISTGPTETAYALTVPTTGWSSVDIPISSFSGVDLTDVIQMKFDGNGDIYLDNIYFFKTGGAPSGPTTAAPTPPSRDAADVVSFYSDAYTDIAIDNFDAGWCGGSAVTEVTIAGNNTLKKNAGIECQGINFASNRQDLSAFTHIHFDIYTDDTDLTGDVFNVKLVDWAGGSGQASALEVNINTGTTPAIVAGAWVSVDVDITSLVAPVAGSLTRSDIAEIGITTTNLTNVWYDNIYVYKDGGGTPATEPAVSAPTPTQDPGDVYSFFSDAYTNISPSAFSQSWGEGAVSDFQIGTDNIKKYTDLNFQAIVLSETVDLADYTHIHVDVWTPIANKFGIKLQDFGADGTDEFPNVDDSEMELESSTEQVAQTWVGHDFAIADFTGLTGTANLGQIQVLLGSLTGGTQGTAFIDNIYLYNDGGGSTEGGPTAAAPTPPTRDAADVISIYGEAYGSEIGLSNVDWDVGSTFVEETVEGNKLLKIDFATFLGTQLNSVVDATDMTHFHMDIWVADDFQAGQVVIPKWSDHAGGAGETSAFLYTKALGDTDVQNWISIDIPITDFTGDYTRANLTEFIIDVAALIDVAYVNNIYFYK
jgi:hypothetical protein